MCAAVRGKGWQQMDLLARMRISYDSDMRIMEWIAAQTARIAPDLPGHYSVTQDAMTEPRACMAMHPRDITEKNCAILFRGLHCVPDLAGSGAEYVPVP
jgi:hypothetical protein